MINYEKPLVVENEEAAEGIYAASGAVVPGPAEDAGEGTATVSAVERIAEGTVWNKVDTYKVTIRNTGNEELRDWTVSVSVTSGTATAAQIYNGWQASASLNGTTITITPGGGGAIGAGGSIAVEVVVSYSSDAITVE